MWAVAGALLGAFAVLSVLGALTGPHTHVAAVLAGMAAAVALIVVGVAGGHDLAWVLLALDLLASAAIGLSAWKGLAHLRQASTRPGFNQLVGAEGVVLSPLSPEGVIKVRGEQWSATSLNGAAAPGSKVQVVRADGVRLEVWSEEPLPPGGTPPLTGTDGPEVSR